MKLAGIVKTADIIEEGGNVFVWGGILLRTKEDWTAPIVILEYVTLVFSDGTSFDVKVIGGEHTGPHPRAIVIEHIAQINNQVPEGTHIYVSDELVEKTRKAGLLKGQV